MIYNKIEELRKQKKVSQEKLASIIDMTRNGLNLAMKNDDFKASTLKKLSDFFNVPVGYFFDEDGQEQARIGVGGRADGAGECVDCKVKDEKIAELQALLEKAEERENRLFDTIAHLQSMCNYPVQNKKAG